MNSIYALSATMCAEKPIFILAPPGKQIQPLLEEWWRDVEHLPVTPNVPQYVIHRDQNVAKKMHQQWAAYWQQSFAANQRWVRAGLFKMPSDYVMRWQKPFAMWLVANHACQIIEPTYLNPVRRPES